MDERAVKDEPKDVQQTKTVGLYPDDIAAVERIRQHYKLEKFGQAVRRAIRDTVEAIPAEEQAEQKERVAA